MIVEEKYQVLSNMPLESSAECTPGTKIWTFEETPNMPHYLVTFVVGNFSPVEKDVVVNYE